MSLLSFFSFFKSSQNVLIFISLKQIGHFLDLFFLYLIYRLLILCFDLEYFHFLQS